MSKEKTNQQILDAFLKANQERKKVLAERAGYSDVEQYRAYLKTKAAGTEKATVQQSDVIINHISVLDCSWSMGGTPMINAKIGLREDYSGIQENDSYYVIAFGSEVKKPYKVEYSTEFNGFSSDMGMTALYDAVASAIEYSNKLSGNCLIKVFTDGEENSSKISAQRLSSLIKKASSTGVTTTFIGTEDTIRMIEKNLKVDSSNTLIYDGTSEGISRSFKTMATATANYTAKAMAGEDVTYGFYKDLV